MRDLPRTGRWRRWCLAALLLAPGCKFLADEFYYVDLRPPVAAPAADRETPP